jgi:hypothetical protein
MASRTSIQSGLDRLHLRCLRRVLATLIALAVVLTSFNCGCCNCVDGDEDFSRASIAQTDCGVPGKPGPLSAAAHCCHCLAHATTVASQVDAVAIRYVANPYRLAAAPVADAADLTSPFVPPRA